jgi:hypothetical protein
VRLFFLSSIYVVDDIHLEMIFFVSTSGKANFGSALVILVSLYIYIYINSQVSRIISSVTFFFFLANSPVRV